MNQKSSIELDGPATQVAVDAVDADRHLAMLEKLAGQAGLDGHQGLQDACLLLVEALQDDSTLAPEVLSLLAAWPGLVDAYCDDPFPGTWEILHFLRHPALKLPLTDEEFSMMETALLEDAGKSPTKVVDELSQPDEQPGFVAADYLAKLEELAGQAGQDGLQGLQDACLLLMEALNAWAEGDARPDAEVLALLNAWPGLIEAYRRQPRQATGEIVRLLRHPGLQLPLTEEEFAAIEAELLDYVGQTAEVADVSQEGAPTARAAADYLAQLEELAGQAAQDGWQGLQDTCLLLVEALNEWADGGDAPDAEVLALFDAWPALVAAYRQNPSEATGEILRVLRHPGLKLPLADEEFDLIGAMLAEGSGQAAEMPVEAATAERDPLVSAIDPAPSPAEMDADERQARLQALPKKVREFVELLLMQTEVIETDLQSLSTTDAESLTEALQETQEQVERLASAAQTVGFSGLALACQFVDANLQHWLGEDAPSFASAQRDLLRAWLGAVKNYLPVFSDSAAGQALLAQAGDARWPLPLSAEQGTAMLAQLRGLDANELSQEEPTRERVASEADVSLELPGDVNQELLDILLQELPGYTQQLAESIQRLQAEGSQQDIELAQRLAHTLKGSANTVGIKGVAVLTHHLEDILLLCAKEHKLPSAALLNTLIDATDCLEAMSDALSGQGEPPPEALAVLQAVLNWANRIDREGLPEADEPAPKPEEEEAAAAEAASKLPQAPSTAPTPVQASAVRVAADLIENLFRISGESIILNGQSQERLRRMKAHLQAMQTQFELLRQLGAELDTLIDLRDLSGRGRSGIDQGFDALEMDQYNELHTASRRMVEAAVDAREISLDARKEMDLMDELLEFQQSLMIETQSEVMRTKLVPIASIAPRLQRSLRQTCRLTGKQAELTLVGGKLLIDGDTLNNLLDPLMHILRNAVDHGIESEEERLAMGKPQVGRIAIAFDSDGNNIQVKCRDDGRGLDFGAIRHAAESRGLVQPGQAVSTEELQRLILQPNFSTRTESTQTSGRGVGMDVVRAQVVGMGGSLVLHSLAGQGLTVDLRVPLPLSRSHALLAYVGQYRVVISNKGLNQVFYSSVGEVQDVSGEPMLLLEDKLYPVAKLNTLLRVPEHRREQRPHGAILLVQTEDQVQAVLVDSITDSRDVVIKNLGYYMGKIPGIMGATILGDGAVTPVIDVPELLRAPAQAGHNVVPSRTEEADDSVYLPSILVVDDSLSNRRALEQLLTDAGFKVRTAHDGVEAAELFLLTKPQIILTDLEMPRMNGIELTTHIRAQTSGKKTPIIMITSRTTQRHRKLAEEAGVDFYLTKPVREDDLLDKINTLLAPGLAQEAHA